MIKAFVSATPCVSVKHRSTRRSRYRLQAGETAARSAMSGPIVIFRGWPTADETCSDQNPTHLLGIRTTIMCRRVSYAHAKQETYHNDKASMSTSRFL